MLTREFSNIVRRLTYDNDQRIRVFYSRGVFDVNQYAEAFRDLIISQLFNRMNAYLACFCQAADRETFYHGLLSQWRAYGVDGGYAIQFNKTKLIDTIEKSRKGNPSRYVLQQVYYSKENPLKEELLKYQEQFHSSFEKYLTELADPKFFEREYMPNPIADLTLDALEALTKYLLFTKNSHFSEEREVRLGQIEVISPNSAKHEVEFLNRNGLIVPYKRTDNESLQLLDCIEGVVVGPSPRVPARYASVKELVRTTDRKILVRASEIPFTRN